MSNLESQPSLPLLPEAHLVSREAWQLEIAQRRHIGEAALSNIQEPLTVKNIEEKEHAYDALRNIILDTFKTEEEVVVMIMHIAGIKKVARGDSSTIKENPFLEENRGKIGPIGPPVDAWPLIMADPKVQEIVDARDISGSHQSLVEGWPHFRETFIHGVKRGIELGYIPTEAENRSKHSLSKTSVRVTDSAILDTYGPLTAYYRTDHDEIGVRDNLKEIGEDLDSNLAHEFTHKVSGGTFKSPDDDSTEYQRPRVGYSTEMKPKVLNRTGLNEAVTHHLTLGIMSGDFETFDPDERADGDMTYYAYRKVMGTFINRSCGLIGVKAVTNAFFEDTGPDGGTKARRKLIRDITNAYGNGALTKLDKLLDLSDSLNNDWLDKIILSRIHPPEIDEHGSVIQRGFIDTENLPTFYDLYKTASEPSQGNVL